jgi:hypothetical protein
MFWISSGGRFCLNTNITGNRWIGELNIRSEGVDVKFSSKPQLTVCDSSKPNSNVRLRLAHPSKQLPTRPFTLAGMHMDNNELHPSKA